MCVCILVSFGHTFIICCGNKWTFIDYKIKVSVVRYVFCVSLSGDYSAVVRVRWIMFTVLNLYHMYISCLMMLMSYFLFFTLRLLLCTFHQFKKRASQHGRRVWTKCECLRSLFSYNPRWRCTFCICVCVRVHILCLQPLPTAVRKTIAAEGIVEQSSAGR